MIALFLRTELRSDRWRDGSGLRLDGCYSEEYSV
jgi:hypothetical protein